MREDWMHLTEPHSEKLLASRLYLKVQWIRSKAKLLNETRRGYVEELEHS